MKINTITCHDVYNAGASLQAYALATFLKQQGHEVKIIDYKPAYLSRRYSLTAVNNPKFEKSKILKYVYIFLKFPRRLVALSEKKKFDEFKKTYMDVTRCYKSLDELKQDPPLADLYIAGSDQIWNTIFQNGKDGAFYLEFAPSSSKKASYAASFATREIATEWVEQVKIWLGTFDRISVREKCSLELLSELNFKGNAVVDPVFLLTRKQWEQFIIDIPVKKGIFVYDFDNNELIRNLSLHIKNESGEIIRSYFKSKYADESLKNPGPIEFLEVIYHSNVVISNSFHATAFALLFHKDFYVIKREEDINVRMLDLLSRVGLENRIISSLNDMNNIVPIEWESVDEKINLERKNSIQYLDELTGEKK